MGVLRVGFGGRPVGAGHRRDATRARVDRAATTTRGRGTHAGQVRAFPDRVVVVSRRVRLFSPVDRRVARRVDRRVERDATRLSGRIESIHPSIRRRRTRRRTRRRGRMMDLYRFHSFARRDLRSRPRARRHEVIHRSIDASRARPRRTVGGARRGFFERPVDASDGRRRRRTTTTNGGMGVCIYTYTRRHPSTVDDGRRRRADAVGRTRG